MSVSGNSRWMRAASVIVVLAVIVLALALAGCGSNSGSTSSSSDGGDPIVIGVDASMTGPLAGFGAHEKWAIDAVVADYNAKGGVTVDGKQRQVKIVLYDDKSDGNVAAKNVDTLITKDKAVAIIGPIVPTVGNPAALAAERRGVPYIESGNPLEPFLGVKADSGGWKYAFDFFVSGANLGESTYKWLADYNLDKQTNMVTATVVDNSSDGPVFDALWTAMAKEYGWTEITLPPYPMNATEFGSLITKLKEADADYVVALGDTPVLIALRKQMDAAGYKPKVMDFARGAQLQQFSDALGPLAEGIVIDSYWTPDTGYPGAAELGARFDEEADFSIGQMVGPSYATGQILMDAITAANSTDPQKVVDAIAATDGEYVCGPIKFDANHTATLQSLITQWQSGKSEIIWPKDMATAEVIFPLP
jgi:branched-chain amino acid transport system substrate-binding protein